MKSMESIEIVSAITFGHDFGRNLLGGAGEGTQFLASETDHVRSRAPFRAKNKAPNLLGDFSGSSSVFSAFILKLEANKHYFCVKRGMELLSSATKRKHLNCCTFLKPQFLFTAL
jgi:hypothetical protein